MLVLHSELKESQGSIVVSGENCHGLLASGGVLGGYATTGKGLT